MFNTARFVSLVVATVVLWSKFGWEVALVYSCTVTAVITGMGDLLCKRN